MMMMAGDKGTGQIRLQVNAGRLARNYMEALQL